MTITKRLTSLFTVFLGLSVGSAQTSALHPALSDSINRLKIGELTSVSHPDVVAGSVDLAARRDLMKAVGAQDTEGIQQLFEAGAIAVLLNETSVRILERDETRPREMMRSVWRVVDIEIESQKNCLRGNMRRAAAGLRDFDCGNFDLSKVLNRRTAEFMEGVAPNQYVDRHVLVLVRVLSGDQKAKKFWVQFDQLNRPSHPEAADSK
jgi:hypothetical protein